MQKFRLTVVGIAVALAVIWYFEGFPFIYYVVTIIAAALFGLFVVGLTIPFYVHLLVNTPGRTTKSGFHLFTYPEEGKVKLVVKGDTLERMIMLYAEHCFARIGERTSPSYWEIRPTKGYVAKIDGVDVPQPDMPEEDPLEGISWFFKPLAWYVFQITGAVYTGIYPFQKVREYSFERIKMHRQEIVGDESDVSGNRGSNISLVVEEDQSDHFRTRQFLYPFRIVSADTKDKIPVEILGVIKAHVTNPHRAAFGTDRWDHQLVNMTTNALTNFTRSTPIDDVLTSNKPEDAQRINNAVLGISEDQKMYGIQIDGVDIIDITANVNDVDRSKLQAEGLARQVGKATVLEGQSRADAVHAMNKVTKKGGAHALEVMRIEGLVRAAEAAQAGTVILPMGGQTSTDPAIAAQLAELKKLNRRLSQQRGA